MNFKNYIFTILYIAFTSSAWSHGDDPAYQFIENKGQWNKNVEFKTNLPNGYMYLEKDGFTYDFLNTEKLAKIRALHVNPNTPITSEEFNLNGHAIKMQFKNSNSKVQLSKDHQSSNYFNYIKGKNPKQWSSYCYSYENIKYLDLYTGIDLDLYTSEYNLKYDLEILPGSDPYQIQFYYEGADEVFIENGNLIVQTTVNTITEQKPYAYQVINGKKIEVSCEFRITNNIVSFYFPNSYNKSTKLIIDPVLIFASYSGSTADNFGMTATNDSHGNLISGGMTYDQGYPTTTGAYDVTSNPNGTTYGITDVVITKYDSTGANLVYSTYIGGGIATDGTETVHSLICNDNDDLYFFGVTSSNDFPMLGSSYDNSFEGGPFAQFTFNGTVFNSGTDIYVSKLSEDGSTLLGSTYIGGSANDGINYAVSAGVYNSVAAYDSLTHNYGDQFRGEVMMDNQSNVYVASMTRSTDFPTVNGFQGIYQGNQDGVVFKLDPDLTSLTWSTYLGGSDKDAGYSIKVDTSGNAYVVGGTVSTDFPTTTGAISETYNGGKVDGFITKIDNSGSSILSSTYYGTNDYDQTYFIEIDRFQDVYVVGQTADSMPVVNVNYYNSNGGQFVSKIGSDLDTIIYSSVFGNGTTINISPSAFLVDHCQNVYVSGWGANILQATPMSGMPVTSDALYPTPPDGFDFYLIVFQRDIDTLLYASYFGGITSNEHVDGGTSRFDKDGVIYQSVCAGCGANDDFPVTPGAWSELNLSSNCNNGVFKMDFQILPNAEFSSSAVEGCQPFSVTFNNTSSSSDSYLWDFGNGDTTSLVFSPTRVYDTVGTFLVKLAVTDSICQLTDTAYQWITVNPLPEAEAGTDTVICAGTSAIVGGAPTGPAGSIYNWDNSFTISNMNAANPTATPTTNTLYTVLVTDTATGCIGIDSILIELNEVGIHVIDSTTTLCDSCIGTATVAPIGGISPYTFLWDDPAAQTTEIGSSLCVGNYMIKIYDSIGCEDSINVIIDDTSNLVLALTAGTDPTCADSCNGSASVLGNGGSTPYSYMWNDPQNQTSQTAFNLCEGVYFVTVSDYYGCKNVNAVSVTGPASLSIIDTIVQINSCFSDCDATGSVQVSGGTPPYSYEWNDPANQQTQSATGLCAGTYNVSSFDANNCIISSSISITEPTELLSSGTGTPPSCQEVCNGTASSSITGGTSPYQFQWLSGANSNSVTGLCPGTYTVSIVDNNGCQTTQTIVVNESSFSFDNINIYADQDSIEAGTSTILHARPVGAYQYNWTHSETLSDNSSDPTASPLETQTYTVTFTDSTGFCVFDTSITIYVYEFLCEDPYVFVPRAFTPNGDGENDILRVRGKNIKEMKLEIYNRWGEKVFETTDQTIGWDGTYNDKEVDPAVYVYYLTVICVDEQEYFNKGNITVIR